jgi:hypothetical protein
MLLREAVAVCCENHMKHTNTVCGKNVDIEHIKAADKRTGLWRVNMARSFSKILKSRWYTATLLPLCGNISQWALAYEAD